MSDRIISLIAILFSIGLLGCQGGETVFSSGITGSPDVAENIGGEAGGPVTEVFTDQIEEGTGEFEVGQIIPNRYIVVFNEDADHSQGAVNRFAAQHGAGVGHFYNSAIKGFAGQIPEARLSAVKADTRVKYVQADVVDRIYEQTEPTGVDRMEADLNSAASGPVDVDVAVVDTGIDLDHPDLNVVSAVSFAGGNGDDKGGHGSHVAGTIGAKNNGSGVVGIAPGARLHAVKVCKPGGICFRSDIIAGLNYIVQNADVIDVANMSLGGSGFDDGNCGLSNNDAEHEAICAVVNSGVVMVVAAGNESTNANSKVPASYDEVITVSALADFDGKGGGFGAPTCRSDQDDSFAGFSNYGADVDLLAPGVCIYSTYLDGGYATMSGTSMASPHVAGLAALYIAENGRDTNNDGVYDKTDVDNIRAALVSSGIPQNSICGLDLFDDPDSFAEPIAFANATVVGGDGSCHTATAPFCGDLICNGTEDCSSCSTDCGACPTCGDAACNGDETCSTCEDDCGVCPFCGDGSCNGSESCSSCEDDCGICPSCEPKGAACDADSDCCSNKCKGKAGSKTCK